MKIIVIKNNDPMHDVEEFIKKLTSLSSPKKCINAKVNYSYSIPSPYSDPEKFPLVITTSDGIKFCILNVSTGYIGDGPHAMYKILKYCDFKFDKDLIFENTGDTPVRFTLTKTLDGTKYHPVAG